MLLLLVLTITSCTSEKQLNQSEQKNEITSYTIQEISNHTTKEDCWLIIENKVYDVTEYIPNHPGGDKILNGCGKDATQMFSKHSPSAREKLPDYLIGNLA